MHSSYAWNKSNVNKKYLTFEGYMSHGIDLYSDSDQQLFARNAKWHKNRREILFKIRFFSCPCSSRFAVWWNGKDITSEYNERFNANGKKKKKQMIYLMDTNVLEVHNIFNSAEFYVFLFPLLFPYLIRSPFFPFFYLIPSLSHIAAKSSRIKRGKNTIPR